MYSRKLIETNREKLGRALSLTLRDYSLTEVMDFEAQLADVEWVEGQASRPYSDKEAAYIANELALCKIDFRYWVNRYGKIINAEGNLAPLQLWPSQEKVLEAMAKEEELAEERMGRMNIPFRCKNKIILLKPRQVGGTVISELLIAHMIIFSKNTRAVIAGDHPDTSLKLYQVLMRIYENLPGWMKPRMDSKVKKEHIHFTDIESDVVVGAGNQRTSLGQGITVDAAHLTEMSTWEAANAFAVDEDLLWAFDSSQKHHSFLLIESTGAGGKGNWFHDQYKLSVEGKSEMKALFVAWYMRPSYVADPLGMEWKDTTLNMAERVKRETGTELSKEQLAYYQKKRTEKEEKGQLDVFFQEFCSTPDEAFQTGLRSVFPIELRSSLRDAVETPIGVYEVDFKRHKLVTDKEWFALTPDKRSWENRLIVWEWARRGCVYVVGIDASYGVEGGDTAAIEVIRVGNKYLPDEQVAEACFTGVAAHELATPAWLIGHLYADQQTAVPAKIACEANRGSPGLITQTELMRRNYPHFYRWRRPLKLGAKPSWEVGWETNSATRPHLTEKGTEALKTRELAVNSLAFIEEMGSFVNMPNKAGVRHLEHAPGYHDDRIFALYIAFYVGHEFDMKNIAEERRLYNERLMKVGEKKPEWASLPMTWEDAMRQLEMEIGR